MSLESKIEKLTTVLETLVVVLEKSASTPSVDAVKTVAKKAVKEVIEKKPVDTVTEQDTSTKSKTSNVVAKTYADLKAKCLEVARAGKKAEVKAVLLEYKAVKANEVAEDKISEVITKLGAL